MYHQKYTAEKGNGLRIQLLKVVWLHLKYLVQENCAATFWKCRATKSYIGLKIKKAKVWSTYNVVCKSIIIYIRTERSRIYTDPGGKIRSAAKRISGVKGKLFFQFTTIFKAITRPKRPVFPGPFTKRGSWRDPSRQYFNIVKIFARCHFFQF